MLNIKDENSAQPVTAPDGQLILLRRWGYTGQNVGIGRTVVSADPDHYAQVPQTGLVVITEDVVVIQIVTAGSPGDSLICIGADRADRSTGAGQTQ